VLFFVSSPDDELKLSSMLRLKEFYGIDDSFAIINLSRWVYFGKFNLSNTDWFKLNEVYDFLYIISRVFLDN